MSKDKIKQVNESANKSEEVFIEKAEVTSDCAQMVEKKLPSDKKNSPKEINGPKGLEPTRYGDWESKGRCYDF